MPQRAVSAGSWRPAQRPTTETEMPAENARHVHDSGTWHLNLETLVGCLDRAHQDVRTCRGPKHLLTNRRHKMSFLWDEEKTRGTRATNIDGVAGSFTWAARSLQTLSPSVRRADPRAYLEETGAFRLRVSSWAELSTEDLPSAGEILKMRGSAFVMPKLHRVTCLSKTSQPLLWVTLFPNPFLR